MSQLSIIILGAGKGTRMKSALPKVLHSAGGKALVDRVIATSQTLKPASVCLIIGHQGDKVRDHVKQSHPKTVFAVQRKLDGSGGAVRQALSWLKKRSGDVIVTCGDAPLICESTFRALLQQHRREKNVATVLTARLADPAAYGRIVRARDGSVERIVEALDATPIVREIKEINTGTYCFDARRLAAVLPKLKNANAKKEFYLTDTLELLRAEGGRVGGCLCADPAESLGVNSRADLALVEKALFERKAQELMSNGVTLIDPSTTYIADAVKIAPDTVIWPHTFIRGNSKIGAGCEIGPWTHLTNVDIENDVKIKASFAEDAIIRTGARIGPYSHLRPGSEVGPEAHVGNFSELKKTKLGRKAKVNHLSYLGDAKVGNYVNIGAGTITCNYDGIAKYPTTIEDHAFIGSNANLIAPVRVGAHSVVGAGSSITRDVPPWALALERATPVVKKDWAKHRTKKGKK